MAGTAYRAARCVLAGGVLSMVTIVASGQDEKVLFDFDGQVDPSEVEAREVQVAVVPNGPGHALELRFGHAADWPGITLKAPEGKWDLSAYRYLALEARNVGTESVWLGCRVDNPGADGQKNCAQEGTEVAPGETETLTVNLVTTRFRLSKPLDLIGMRGAPGHGKLDPTNVIGLVIFLAKPSEDHAFVIDSIRVGGTVETLDADTFLPFIDTFGQFIHRDWPGKVRDVADLRSRIESEARDLAEHPGPTGRGRYGGWAEGPTLEATGFFRVEKRAGTWWLVDPDGLLFWSHGVDCVNPYNSTPISDRENYFADLPADDSPLARFYGRGNWAPHGYYKDHAPYRHYGFCQANLFRKYGEGWFESYADACHRRLQSWGMNTIANWSDGRICAKRRTPYVGTIHYNAPKIEGSEGYWSKFYDVFDPAFREALRKRMAGEAGKQAGDPWCIGFFVDNELSWGSDTSLATAALASPPDQPAKREFVADLRKSYTTIDALNQAWGTAHASWDALLEARTAPDGDRAGMDLRRFYRRVADAYFRTVRDAVKEVAPDQLYFGCRFAWVNDIAARAATEYCDVVSYNRYTYSVEDLALPDGIDRPTIIGEFHFGALDRGMFHTGLRTARDQAHRAQLYEEYVRGALRNPQIVGTHWFQFHSQATTGRGDGENYQIGLLDICDTPYPETIDALRRVGYGMYRYRADPITP